jgi:hypothetical protein
VKEGKKGRQAMFHDSAFSLSPFCLSTTLRSFGTEISLRGFFKRAGKATAKQNIIKEDVQ